SCRDLARMGDPGLRAAQTHERNSLTSRTMSRTSPIVGALRDAGPEQTASGRSSGLLPCPSHPRHGGQPPSEGCHRRTAKPRRIVLETRLLTHGSPKTPKTIYG